MRSLGLQLLLFLWANAENLKLKVLYESRCPDSEIFFRTQLMPTIKEYPDIELELVPYGKATTNFVEGHKKFECQHGNLECEGNRFHACAIDQIKSAKVQAAVTTCMMSGYATETPKARAEKCCKAHGVDFPDVLECATSNEGAELLYRHGIETNRWEPDFIPTILLNDEDEPQKELRTELMGVVRRSLAGANAGSSTIGSNLQRARISFKSGAHLSSSMGVVAAGIMGILNSYV